MLECNADLRSHFDLTTIATKSPVGFVTSPDVTDVRAAACQAPASRQPRTRHERPVQIGSFVATVFSRRPLSDRDFVAQCLRNLPSAKVVPLLLPSPFSDRAFCVQVVCDELQGLDWHLPPRYNLARIQALYRTPARSLCRLPHPLA